MTRREAVVAPAECSARRVSVLSHLHSPLHSPVLALALALLLVELYWLAGRTAALQPRSFVATSDFSDKTKAGFLLHSGTALYFACF